MAGDIILDGREWNRSFTLCLKKMQEAGLLCDAAILCTCDEEGSPKPILAHACVLAASSPTLKNMLLKQDADPETGVKHVENMGFGDRIWRFLLEFMYKSRVVIPAEHRHYLREIEDAAMTLSVKGLIDAVTLAQTGGDEVVDIVARDSADDSTQDIEELIGAKEAQEEKAHASEPTEAVLLSPTKRSKRLALKRENPKSLGSQRKKQKRNINDFDDDDTDYRPSTYIARKEDNVCDICDGVFPSRRPLQQHMKLFHPEAKRYFCKKCSTPFNNPVALEDHNRKEHEATLLECIVCYKEFYTKDAWRRHMRLYHPDVADSDKAGDMDLAAAMMKVEEVDGESTVHPLLSVEEVDGESILQPLLSVGAAFIREHEQADQDANQTGEHRKSGIETVYANIEVYEAADTNEEVADVTGETDEVVDTTGEADEAVDIIGGEETDEVVLADDDEEASEDDTPQTRRARLRTKVRQVAIRIKEDLEEKLRPMRKSGKYRCEECLLGFQTQNGLVAHQQKRHPDKYRGKHECAVCHRTFGQLGHLEDHHRLKHDGEPLQCTMCDMTFKTRDGIYRHERFKHHLAGRRVLKKRQQIACGNCDATFRQLAQLEDHARKEHSAPPLICETCGTEFITKDTLYRHNRYMHGDKGKDMINIMADANLTEEDRAMHQEAIEWRKANCKFSCNLCDYIASSRFMLDEHAKKHSDEKDYNCELCHKEFKYKVGLMNHQAKHHPEIASTIYNCPNCTLTFGRNVYLEDHLRKKHNRPRLQCDYCDKTCITYDAMYRHKRYGHPGKAKQRIKVLHKCELCDYTTLSKGSLDTHRLIHTNVRAFICEVCGMDFKYKGDLVKHTRTNHMPDYQPKTYTCDLCNLECKNRNILTRHYISRHKKEFSRSFPCEICKKDFGSKTNRDDHVRFDHNGETIQCQFCKQQFYDVNTWYDHKQQEHPDHASRVLLSDDVFACGICHKEFRKIPLLRRHERYHVTRRPYKCEEIHCGATFVAKEDLKVHRKVHSGEKPFSCPHCTFTTLRKPALTTHMRKHDESQHLHCPQCQRTYVIPISLRKHLRSAHGLDRAEENRIMDSMQKQETVYLKIEQESCTEDLSEADNILIAAADADNGQVYRLQNLADVSAEIGAAAVITESGTQHSHEIMPDPATMGQPQQQMMQDQVEYEQEQQPQAFIQIQERGNEQFLSTEEAVDGRQQPVEFASVQQMEMVGDVAGAGDAGGGGGDEQVVYIMADEDGTEQGSGQVIRAHDENGQEVMYIKLSDNQYVQVVDADVFTQGGQ